MLRGDLPPTALFQDATLKCAVAKCTEVTCRLLHLCRGSKCGHYGRTTDWLGVESFKLNKHKTGNVSETDGGQTERIMTKSDSLSNF